MVRIIFRELVLIMFTNQKSKEAGVPDAPWSDQVGKQTETHTGDSPKWVKSRRRRKKKKREREREKERLNNGENNGQATHGARKHAWRTQAAWAKRKRERLNNGEVFFSF